MQASNCRVTAQAWHTMLPHLCHHGCLDPVPASSGPGAGPLRAGRLRLRRGPLMCKP